MGDLVLIDNDVVFKTCAYASGAEFLEIINAVETQPSMLTVSRYAVKRRIERGRDVRHPNTIKTEWAALGSRILDIEPTTSEIDLAAELEERAIQLSLDLDSGESQLFAILYHRGAGLMLTGDKRALHAINALGQQLPPKTVACFEQLVYSILGITGLQELRMRICHEPTIDRSVALCFSSSNPTMPPLTSVLEGLQSYTDAVRAQAPALLIPGYEISVSL